MEALTIKYIVDKEDTATIIRFARTLIRKNRWRSRGLSVETPSSALQLESIMIPVFVKITKRLASVDSATHANSSTTVATTNLGG